MRRTFPLAAILLAALTATSQEKPLKQLPYTPSLDIPSMDKTADPCVDFYQFTCGGWMVNNPIPADQARWSVYGKTTNENAQFLWGILEEASNAEANRTAVQTQIGDYFAACMNEPAIEKLGAKPLKPTLDEIAALESRKELAAYLAKQHSRTYTSGFIFGFGSTQDFGDATQVIAEVGSGGLGLPDRDYYTKTDAKSQEIRDKYLAHVAKMLELLGETKAQAKKDAQSVMAIETAMAKASLTRVERRDPYKVYHKMKVAELQKLTPSFDWSAYFEKRGLVQRRRRSMSRSRSSSKRWSSRSQRRRCRSGRRTSAGRRFTISRRISRRVS